MTIEEQAREKLKSVVVLKRSQSEKDMINAARTVFPNCYFDQDRCAEGINHLRHYRFEVDQQTKQFSQHPKHDEHSDASKAFEYFAIASKMRTGRTQLTLRGHVAAALGFADCEGEYAESRYYGSPGASAGWLSGGRAG